MEGSASAIAPLLLRNLLTSLFIHADKSLIYLVKKCRLLQILRRLLASAFLFFLRLLPSLFPSLNPSSKSQNRPFDEHISLAGCSVGGGVSGVERALTQLLLIMNDIPVSSRKYEVVRSLAEKLIDGNLSEEENANNQVLRKVNCAVLSAAFARTLSQLEDAVMGRRGGGDGGGDGCGEATTGVHDSNDQYYIYNGASRLLRAAKYCGRVMWRYAKPRDERSRSRSSADKLVAEILWLAHKMTVSGCANEAVCKWASASNLAWHSMTAEPRLQGSLVKVSALLIKQAREMGNEEENGKEGNNMNMMSSVTIRQTKMKMLLSWLPLLCRANNGTDAPVMNMSERAELEKVLEEIIWTLDEKEEEEQERVLSLWLHHFTYCSASDWPNLRSCYTTWFGASRTRLMLQHSSSTHAP